MPASLGRHKLLHERLEQFTKMFHGLEQGDARALHRTRVASRRLREVLPVLQLEAGLAHKLNRRLRKVTERLGIVRELDVLLLLVGELRHVGRHDQAALSRLAEVFTEENEKARERLFAKLPLTELQRVANKLGRVALGAEPDGSHRDGEEPRGWRWTIDTRVARRASSLSQAIHEAGAVYLPDRLHLVRIALKKLRYVFELSEEASGAGVASPRARRREGPAKSESAGARPPDRASDLQTLARAQDVLGRMHDVQVLIDRVRQLQASLTPPDLTMWHGFDELVTSLEDECRRLHARFMRMRPAIQRVCDRVGARAQTGSVRRAAAS